ncbi:uncharacterized protein LOC126664219 [Mercurialis annua]|uniref:uncharacterized protein LOC126664219 n=1 Tax=Mercurialis annua TaxID=3986 RepID=UPI00215FF101|nr:uncharacterized protein LOC126664219 [Mercurialis annua]
MAFNSALLLLLLALSLSGLHLSTSQVLQGKLSCLDCSADYDFSGIKVLVKCANVKKLGQGTTTKEGSFEVELPSTSTHETPSNCLAKLIGGTTQLYSTTKKMVSKIVKSHDSNSYTISTPLAFYTVRTNLKGIGESKTVDLPLPKEWGLAPSSYYVPFFPIIGIP